MKQKLYLIFKRLQDILLSTLAIIVLFPFSLIISLIIFIDDPQGGPLYSQIRVGENGRFFKMFKFRSMRVNADDELDSLMCKNEMTGPAFKMKDDPRVTRVGKIIRKYCIDELPQLWNVLIGDMSIVGPRPPLKSEYERFTEFQKQKLSVQPGLTCIWQVTPDKNLMSVDEWVKLDLNYIENRSFLLDWKLIFKTILVIL